eukprot:1384711-Pyramimonas_sp.AAC.1
MIRVILTGALGFLYLTRVKLLHDSYRADTYKLSELATQLSVLNSQLELYDSYRADTYRNQFGITSRARLLNT